MTSYGYNNADQPVSVGYSDGVTPNVSYTFKPNGHRSTMIDGTGTSGYTYDSLGRLVTSVNCAAQTVGYGYDKSSRQTALTYPGATGVSSMSFVGRWASGPLSVR